MPALDPIQHAQLLADSLSQLRAHRGKTFVIKYGGNAMTDPALQAAFAADVVQLKLMGIKVVVVHGGGPQIDAALQKVGKQGEFVNGMRVTDADTMQVVQWVLEGQVQPQIVGLVHLAGSLAVGLTGRDGGLISARKLQAGHDYGFVGQIEHVNPAVLQTLLAGDIIPVVSPIGFDAANQSYNINADVAAGEIAKALGAEKLIMLTNIRGVLDKSGALLPALSAAQIDALIADGTISGGMIPKLAGALDAAKSGVNKVHIIDGRVPHALLLETLTQEAFGTMISAG